MSNISIEGLTAKQKALMDVMWSMSDMTNVTAFVKTLPKRDAQDCMSLIEIAVQLSYEQDGALDDYKELAAAAISRARYSL
jgi:hypothetical protein